MNNSKTRKKKKQEFINKFKPIVNNHNGELPIFDYNKKYNIHKYNTHSWFNIDKFNAENKTNVNVISSDKLDDVNLKCIKVKMILTDIHKQILNKWFMATTFIYNKTLEYIRTTYPFTKKDIFRSLIDYKSNLYNKRYIRTQMYQEKKDIQELFTILIDKHDTKNKKNNIKCTIDIHTLDKSIFQLIENIKSARANILAYNIKRFRLKFWKFNRPSQTIELEKNKFKDGVLCKSIFNNLEDIKYSYNNKIYNKLQVDHDFKINHNLITDEYYLYIPISSETEDIENRKELIVLDPGLRTMFTGLSESETLNLGSNINDIIKQDIIKLNKIKNNKLIPSKIKKKYERRIYKKVENKVDGLHWKLINYLTSNYKTIFLGDMSAKSIVSKSNKVLSKEAKVACLRSKYYEFRLRLKYKCSLTNTKFKLVNECYTSKTCSLCGYYNDKLKGEKIYHCLNCNRTIDRDINACRNIYMKQYL